MPRVTSGTPAMTKVLATSGTAARIGSSCVQVARGPVDGRPLPGRAPRRARSRGPRTGASSLGVRWNRATPPPSTSPTSGTSSQERPRTRPSSRGDSRAPARPGRGRAKRATAFPRACGLSRREHIIGVSVSATKPETSTAPASASANSMNSRPVRPGVRAIGRVDRGQGQGHGDDREDDLARADQRRLERRLAGLDVAVDVLQHDDRVVDDEADRQHQGQQRQRVDREAERRTSARRSRSARPGSSPPGSAWRGTSAGTASVTSTTRPTASAMVANTAAIERSMNTVVSLAITASMPAGRFSTSSGRAARTARATSSGLAVACLMMPIVTEFLPLKRVARRSSSAPISTSRHVAQRHRESRRRP